LVPAGSSVAVEVRAARRILVAVVLRSGGGTCWPFAGRHAASLGWWMISAAMLPCCRAAATVEGCVQLPFSTTLFHIILGTVSWQSAWQYLQLCHMDHVVLEIVLVTVELPPAALGGVRPPLAALGGSLQLPAALLEPALHAAGRGEELCCMESVFQGQVPSGPADAPVTFRWCTRSGCGRATACLDVDNIRSHFGRSGRHERRLMKRW
jgi:hypothetical protein